LNGKPSNKQTKVRETVLAFSCGVTKDCHNRSLTAENRLRNGVLRPLWPGSWASTTTLTIYAASRRYFGFCFSVPLLPFYTSFIYTNYTKSSLALLESEMILPRWTAIHLQPTLRLEGGVFLPKMIKHNLQIFYRR